ncbi:hypothetical protein HK405_011376, partial [Cladochytrium tenue]
MPHRTPRSLVSALRLAGLLVRDDFADSSTSLHLNPDAANDTFLPSLLSALTDTTSDLDAALPDWTSPRVWGVGAKLLDAKSREVEREKVAGRLRGRVSLARVAARKPPYAVGAAARISLRRRAPPITLASEVPASEAPEPSVSNASLPSQPAENRLAVWEAAAAGGERDTDSVELEDEAELLDPADRQILIASGGSGDPSCPNTAAAAGASAVLRGASVARSLPRRTCDRCKCGLADEVERRWNAIEAALDRDLAFMNGGATDGADGPGLAPKSSCATRATDAMDVVDEVPGADTQPTTASRDGAVPREPRTQAVESDESDADEDDAGSDDEDIDDSDDQQPEEQQESDQAKEDEKAAEAARVAQAELRRKIMEIQRDMSIPAAAKAKKVQ